MLAGDFERKLRKLNHNLRIYCGNDNKYAAGIFIVSPSGEYVEICGVDKNYLPEHPIYREDGGFYKSGWKRVLKILIGKGLLKKEQTEKEFGKVIGARAPSRPQIKRDSSLKRLQDLGVEIIESGSY